MVFRNTPRALWVILAAAFLVRLLAIVVDSSLGILASPDVSLFNHQRAIATAEGWLGGQFAPPREFVPPGRIAGPRRSFVTYLLLPFYLILSPLTGSSMLPGRLAIAAYSLGLGVVGYALARECRLSTRWALLVGGGVVFWPGVIYRSVVIQREMIVALATLAVVWIGVRWATEDVTTTVEIVASAAVTAAALGTLYLVRPENLLIAAVVLAAATVVRYREHTRSLAATGVFAVGGGIFAVTNIGAFIGGRGGARGRLLSADLLNTFAHARAHGDSAYLTWVHYETWFDIALFAPLKVVYFLGSPMLWSASGMSGLIAGASGLALLLMAIVAVYGVVSVMRGRTTADWRAVAVLCVFLVVGVGAYAIIEMNGGAAFRRRITFVPAILALAAVGVLGR